MKAIVVRELGGPEVLGLDEVPDLVPGPGEAVVRVKAAGVNPVETYLRSGTYSRQPALPWTPGTDAAGVVESVGPGVGGVVPGDRVYTYGTLSGGYAERALCRTSQLHPLPDALSFEQGAAVGIPYATAYRALFHKARAVSGEWVLVRGASGGVGTAALQIARAAGLEPVGTSGTEKGRRLALEQGARHALDHEEADDPGRALALTAGRGFDLILEMLADRNLGNDLRLLAKHGRVVVIGCRGTVEISPREAMTRDAAVLGMVLANATEAELASIHEALGEGFANASLRPVVGRTFPLKDAAQAHRLVLEPGAYGKIVLLP